MRRLYPSLTALALLLLLAPCAAADRLAERIEGAAAEAARAHIRTPDRLEMLSARFGGADPIPAGDYRLELAAVQGPNASGTINVRFRMVVDGLPKGEARATVRGRVLGPVLQTARLLTKDSVIANDDLQVHEADITRLTEAPLRSAEQAVGRVTLRTYGKGRVLTAALIAPAPVISKGQTINLLVERQGLIVKVLGRALRDGAAGETIPAENSRTGARVEGRVQPDGSLRVVRPGGARRS